jgi:hypothetical protein
MRNKSIGLTRIVFYFIYIFLKNGGQKQRDRGYGGVAG